MSDTLTVTIWPDADSIMPETGDTPGDGVVFHEVDYVSLVNHGTFGPPALVAPKNVKGVSEPPTARPGQSVLYVNTSIIPLFRIERDGE